MAALLMSAAFPALSRGGDFVGTDYSKLYAVDYTDNNLYTISTSTGAKTLIGNMGTPLNNGTWRDLTWDPTANKMYAMATYFEMDVPVSKNVLYEVNISTGAKTWIGTDAIGLYDGAIDPSTGVFYAISSAYQALYTVNKASGATSFVGFLDTTASFQSLDFDDSNGVLYGITDAGELRTINISNAATTLVGTLSQSGFIDAFAVASGTAGPTPTPTPTPTATPTPTPTPGPGGGSPYYAVNNTTHQLVTGTTASGSLTNVGNAPGFFTGGDFVGSDYSKFYAVNIENNILYTISTSTGIPTAIRYIGEPSRGCGTILHGIPLRTRCMHSPPTSITETERLFTN